MNNNESILKLLLGMFQNQAYSNQPPFSFSGHRSNMGVFNKSYFDMGKEWLFPHLGQRAPIGVQPFDFKQTLELNTLRQSMQSELNAKNEMANITAQMVLTNMFPKQGMQYFNKLKNNPFGNMAINMAYSSIFGQSPRQQQASAVTRMHQYFSGTSLIRPDSQRFTTPHFGLARKEAMDISDRLMKATYIPGTGQSQRRIDAFGISEMTDIAMLTKRYGGRSRNVGEIVSQTRNVAKLIRTGMDIYGTMDKEGVFKSITELTRGSMNIGTNTTQIEVALQKINSVAKAANVSMKVMQKVVAESAGVWDQLGMSPLQGAVKGAQLFGMAQDASRFYSTKDLNRAGGRHGLLKQFTVSEANMVRSTAFSDAALVYSNAKLALGPGATQDEISAFQNKIMTQARRGQVISSDVTMKVQKGMLANLEKDFLSQGFSAGEAKTKAYWALRGRLMEARSEGAKDFYDKAFSGPLGPVYTARNELKQSLIDARMSSAQADKLIYRASQGDASAKRIIESTYRSQLAAFSDMSPKQINAKISSIVPMATMNKQALDDLRRKGQSRNADSLANMAAQRSRSYYNQFTDPIKKAFFSGASLGEMGETLLESVFGGLEPALQNTPFKDMTHNQQQQFLKTLKDTQFKDVQEEHLDWGIHRRFKQQRAVGRALLGRKFFAREGVPGSSSVYAFGSGGFLSGLTKAYRRRASNKMDFATALGNMGLKGINQKALFDQLKDKRLTLLNFRAALESQDKQDVIKGMSEVDLFGNKKFLDLYLSFAAGVKNIDDDEARVSNIGSDVMTNIKLYSDAAKSDMDKFERGNVREILGSKVVDQLLKDTSGDMTDAKTFIGKRQKVIKNIQKYMLQSSKKNQKDRGAKAALGIMAGRKSILRPNTPEERFSMYKEKMELLGISPGGTEIGDYKQAFRTYIRGIEADLGRGTPLAQAVHNRSFTRKGFTGDTADRLKNLTQLTDLFGKEESSGFSGILTNQLSKLKSKYNLLPGGKEKESQPGTSKEAKSFATSADGLVKSINELVGSIKTLIPKLSNLGK